MKSIKKRLVGAFILVILITILIFEVLLIGLLRQYYYNNAQELLTNQIEISSDFYSRYFSNTSLEDNILDNVDVFWNQTDNQVQILDLYGNVLMDSIGVIHEDIIITSDVEKALQGKNGTWTGKVTYDDYSVMAVSYPLKSEGEIVGVIRFITSLEQIDKSITNISIIFIIIGLGVMIIATIVSYIISNTIVSPIKEVTKIAEKMAKGNFKIRGSKKYDDEIGKLSTTLNYMAEEIIKKEELKNDFISSVSHELRTPLTSIKGWAATLNTDHIYDKETMKDGLTIIENETQRLTTMVEELLDFSKFISGKTTLIRQNTDIREILDYIKIHMQSRAQRENLLFRVNSEENLSEVYIDRDKIKQVLINIVDNSFRFTKAGGKVVIDARVQDKYLIIEIEDNGYGIDEDDLPKIKEKFYKGKTAKSKTGLGLAISDEIIKAHNGELSIESKLGEGTKVIIKIPINYKVDIENE
ncbi:sensor histidine kinase [Senegalia sp. (in: firmicutes)]|uniref:sensor histidine kinase n=1 Tax=Senegalia sp. (in: firmicutes) TaxID=1924098 RepID=UPI003F94776D